MDERERVIYRYKKILKNILLICFFWRKIILKLYFKYLRREDIKIAVSFVFGIGKGIKN